MCNLFRLTIAGKEEKVSPRDLVAILLLDGPQQTASLVKTDVVGPAIERGEALLTTATATATVLNTIGTRAVPCHTDEETGVGTEVCGPPFLAVGHQVIEILLETIVIQALKRLGVIEVAALRAVGRSLLAEDVEP